jgi:serine palmitoyltransferase
LLTRSKYVVSQERNCPQPSIRVAVAAGFTKREVERTAGIIRDSIKKTLKKYRM